VLVESAKQIAQLMKGEIELPMKVVRVVPDADVRSIREGQGLTREQFAERSWLQVRAIQEWEQGRRKRAPAVCAYYARHQESARRGAEGIESSVQGRNLPAELLPRSRNHPVSRFPALL
jgi:hypothetical protein